MKDYYDEEMSRPEDDFWNDVSTELEFPWDDIPDDSEGINEKKTL